MSGEPKKKRMRSLTAAEQQRLCEEEEARKQAEQNALFKKLMAEWEANGKPSTWFKHEGKLLFGNELLYGLQFDPADPDEKSDTVELDPFSVIDALTRAPFWGVHGDNSLERLKGILPIAERALTNFPGYDVNVLVLLRMIAEHMMGNNKLVHRDSCALCVHPGLLGVPFCPQYPGRSDGASFSRLLTLVVVVMAAGVKNADDCRSMLDVLIPPVDDDQAAKAGGGAAEDEDEDDDDDDEDDDDDDDYKLLARRSLRPSVVDALMATANAVAARISSLPKKVK